MNLLKTVIIDWVKTGQRLKELRESDFNLRRYVCYFNKVNNHSNEDKYYCYHSPLYDCETCSKEMDKKISRRELGNVFSVSEDVVENWENGNTIIDIEELLLYAKICKIDLMDILVITE